MEKHNHNYKHTHTHTQLVSFARQRAGGCSVHSPEQLGGSVSRQGWKGGGKGGGLRVDALGFRGERTNTEADGSFVAVDPSPALESQLV